VDEKQFDSLIEPRLFESIKVGFTICGNVVSFLIEMEAPAYNWKLEIGLNVLKFIIGKQWKIYSSKSNSIDEDDIDKWWKSISKINFHKK
jgi:hypothetical protein